MHSTIGFPVKIGNLFVPTGREAYLIRDIRDSNAPIFPVVAMSIAPSYCCCRLCGSDCSALSGKYYDFEGCRGCMEGRQIARFFIGVAFAIRGLRAITRQFGRWLNRKRKKEAEK